MKKWNNYPVILKRKTIFTLFVGVCCISITFLIFLICKDCVLLALGTTFLLGCLIRSGFLCHIMIHQKYSTITGVCIGSCSSLLRKYRKVYLIDDDGNETALLLGKGELIKKVALYRFYFHSDNLTSFGNNYLDTALAAHTFLGYEELPQNLLCQPAE